jgi:uncharacterized protein with NRDE domain
VCTLVILIRPDHSWPIALAANRDEQQDRPWDSPAAWWPDRPGIVAGCDRSGGGTWLGLNAAGVAAAVLNRPGSLGPAPGKRTRGELPLIALDHASTDTAVAAVTKLDAADWRSFNMVVADRRGAMFIRGLGRGRPAARVLAPGLHMITAHDPDDPDSPRVARHLARFRTAVPPDADQWQSWSKILADRAGSPAEQINVVPRAGFGTICSSLIALPATLAPIWLFAAGPPDVAPFLPVDLESSE